MLAGCEGVHIVIIILPKDRHVFGACMMMSMLSPILQDGWYTIPWYDCPSLHKTIYIVGWRFSTSIQAVPVVLSQWAVSPSGGEMEVVQAREEWVRLFRIQKVMRSQPTLKLGWECGPRRYNTLTPTGENFGPYFILCNNMSATKHISEAALCSTSPTT
jgi:hypothetical protein